MDQKKYAVFTMDVETFADTECIRSSGIQVDVDLMDGMEEYLKILDRHNIKSTLFTVGDLAPRIADRLRQYISQGHQLALHGHSHIAPLIISSEEFRAQTEQTKAQLQQLFDGTIQGFRAPCFSMDRERLDILSQLGFTYDSSLLDFQPARHTAKLDLADFQQLQPNIFRRDGFYEFGLSKEKVFGIPFPISGGGYVRLSDWGFVRALIRHFIRKNNYYVFYLHPFELTKKKVPFLRELKFYDRYYIRRGIRTYGRRIERIIRMLKKDGYEFVTFEQMVQIMDRV